MAELHRRRVDTGSKVVLFLSSSPAIANTHYIAACWAAGRDEETRLRCEEMIGQSAFWLALPVAAASERTLSPEDPGGLLVQRLNMNSMRGTLVFDGALCIGWLGCLSEGSSCEHSELCSETLIELCVQAHRSMSVDAPPPHILCSSDGRVEACSRGGDTWIDAHRREALTDSCRSFDFEQKERSLCVIGGHVFACTRLEGDNDLLLFSAPEGPSGAPRPDFLPERQRQIAQLTMLGLSSREIAEHIGASDDAVRRQLSKLYRLFGVRRKASLVDLFGGLVFPRA